MPKMRMKNAVVIPRVRVLKRIMCKNSAWCCRGEACLARHRGRVLAAIQKVLPFVCRCLSSSRQGVSRDPEGFEVFALSLECIIFCQKRQSVFICGCL